MTTDEVKNIANETIEHLIYNLIEERKANIRMCCPYALYADEKPEHCGSDDYDCSTCIDDFFENMQKEYLEEFLIK